MHLYAFLWYPVWWIERGITLLTWNNTLCIIMEEGREPSSVNAIMLVFFWRIDLYLGGVNHLQRYKATGQCKSRLWSYVYLIMLTVQQDPGWIHCFLSYRIFIWAYAWLYTSYRNCTLALDYRKKSFKTQHGRIPTDPAILARFIICQCNVNTCNDEFPFKKGSPNYFIKPKLTNRINYVFLFNNSCWIIKQIS